MGRRTASHAAAGNRRRAWLLAACGLLAACAVNPVTGERHLQFYDTDWEREVGSAYYQPLRQQQGGDFSLDPELTAYVQSVGERLATHARRKDELGFEFSIVNDSTPNAWALPGGKIALHRGLLTELQSEAELAAVIGHEIVHADAAHSARQQSKGVLTQAGAMAGMVLIGSKADSSAGRAAAVLVPALGAQLLTQKYSRDAEREADLYGMRYMSEAGYDPAGAVQLQETFVRLAEGRRQDWLSGLFASHPPSRERVERNRETAGSLPGGGESSAERYLSKTAYLRRIEPAYEAYDRALKLAGEENYPGAREALDEALAIEPREALFHALDGDLKVQAGDQSAALDAYEQAVSLDDGFFYHRLRRGQLLLEEGRREPARADLEASVALLPTALGHHLLGNLERDAGNRAAAIGHYEKAAASDSETGRQAQRELVLLDIGANPQKYVATAAAADRTGQLYCVLGNRTNVALGDIMVNARFRDDAGELRQARQLLEGGLGGGARASIAMGWQTADSSGLDQRMACQVESARASSER
jgi:predicted Zn-dependent protease